MKDRFFFLNGDFLLREKLMDPNPGSTLFRCLFLVGVSTSANSWVAGPSALYLPCPTRLLSYACAISLRKVGISGGRQEHLSSETRKGKRGPHPQLGTSHRGLPCYFGSDEAEVILCHSVWVKSVRASQKVLAKLMACLTILLNQHIPCPSLCLFRSSL